MVSAKQIRFFEELLDEKEIPEPHTAEGLLEQFKKLPNKKSASVWVEKMLTLPDKGEIVEETVEPTF